MPGRFFFNDNRIKICCKLSPLYLPSKCNKNNFMFGKLHCFLFLGKYLSGALLLTTCKHVAIVGHGHEKAQFIYTQSAYLNGFHIHSIWFPSCGIHLLRKQSEDFEIEIAEPFL